MKINDLNVEGFGVWSELKIDGLSDRLGVFFGPNEAGKTTLLQFVRAMLYGFSPARRRYSAISRRRRTAPLSGFNERRMPLTMISAPVARLGFLAENGSITSYARPGARALGTIFITEVCPRTR